ncbi:MAG: GerMN domain-containing protein [Acidobacteria bacterium]|nr:GerMN domain-containing protein [Acidobacteriota bacterium]
MTTKQKSLAGAAALAACAAGWLGYAALFRTEALAPLAADGTATVESPPAPARKIKARLFYVAPDGRGLVSVEREVPFGEGTAAQAQAIVEAQIAPVGDPLLSAVPPGTALRSVFITERGDAYVDLSGEAASAHPGGTLNELLTVYTIVNAVTTNLPAVSGVQILVGGREVDTLAGHVDLRRPLTRDLSWVQ